MKRPLPLYAHTSLPKLRRAQWTHCIVAREFVGWRPCMGSELLGHKADLIMYWRFTLAIFRGIDCVETNHQHSTPLLWQATSYSREGFASTCSTDYPFEFDTDTWTADAAFIYTTRWVFGTWLLRSRYRDVRSCWLAMQGWFQVPSQV